jgi:hypothetical protein
MKLRFSFVFFAVLFLALGTSVYAQQQQPDMNDPAMKAMMAYATPGPVQKAMQGMVGTWNTEITSYMDPAKPEKSQGTSTFTSIMDGRYIQESFQSTFMGQPFQGLGTHGYDNVLKKYVGTWLDNMGTGIMVSTGTSTDNGKTINYTGRGVDPVSGKEITYRSVMHNMSPDQSHFEMYGPGPDGKEMKMMEIMYTRKK